MKMSLFHHDGLGEARNDVADSDERTGIFSDLKVVCGGREWNLHRNILSSRCEWFDKALRGDFREAHTQEIMIQEFDPGDIELMLEYIYIGDIDFELQRGEAPLIDICIRFYDLADFFALPKLQECAVSQFRQYNTRKCAPLQNQFWKRDIDNIDEILYDLRAAYGQNTVAGDAFRGLMATFVHETRFRFFRCQQFIALLDEIPELAADVLTTMIRSGEFMHITYPEACSACLRHKSDKEHHSHTIISSMSRAYSLCIACANETKQQVTELEQKSYNTAEIRGQQMLAHGKAEGRAEFLVEELREIKTSLAARYGQLTDFSCEKAKMAERTRGLKLKADKYQRKEQQGTDTTKTKQKQLDDMAARKPEDDWNADRKMYEHQEGEAANAKVRFEFLGTEADRMQQELTDTTTTRDQAQRTLAEADRGFNLVRDKIKTVRKNTSSLWRRHGRIMTGRNSARDLEAEPGGLRLEVARLTGVTEDQQTRLATAKATQDTTEDHLSNTKQKFRERGLEELSLEDQCKEDLASQATRLSQSEGSANNYQNKLTQAEGQIAQIQQSIEQPCGMSMTGEWQLATSRLGRDIAKAQRLVIAANSALEHAKDGHTVTAKELRQVRQLVAERMSRSVDSLSETMCLDFLRSFCDAGEKATSPPSPSVHHQLPARRPWAIDAPWLKGVTAGCLNHDVNLSQTVARLTELIHRAELGENDIKLAFYLVHGIIECNQFQHSTDLSAELTPYTLSTPVIMSAIMSAIKPFASVKANVPRGTLLGVYGDSHHIHTIEKYMKQKMRVLIVGMSNDMSHFVYAVCGKAEGDISKKSFDGHEILIIIKGGNPAEPTWLPYYVYTDRDVAVRISNYCADATTLPGAPWTSRKTWPTLPNGKRGCANVEDAIEGTELPDILLGCKLKYKTPFEAGDQRVLKPDARVPVIACRSLAPKHEQQPKLTSGIHFFKSYDLPSTVEDDLKEIIKALAPTDILEPYGLMKLALLNWWHDNPAEKLSDYLAFFKTMVLYVMRVNLAAFPKMSAFIESCRTVDTARMRAALDQSKPEALGSLWPCDIKCFGQVALTSREQRTGDDLIAVNQTDEMLGDLRRYQYHDYGYDQTLLAKTRDPDELYRTIIHHSQYSTWAVSPTTDDTLEKLDEGAIKSSFETPLPYAKISFPYKEGGLYHVGMLTVDADGATKTGQAKVGGAPLAGGSSAEVDDRKNAVAALEKELDDIKAEIPTLEDSLAKHEQDEQDTEASIGLNAGKPFMVKLLQNGLAELRTESIPAAKAKLDAQRKLHDDKTNEVDIAKAALKKAEDDKAEADKAAQDDQKKRRPSRDLSNPPKRINNGAELLEATETIMQIPPAYPHHIVFGIDAIRTERGLEWLNVSSLYDIIKVKGRGSSTAARDITKTKAFLKPLAKTLPDYLDDIWSKAPSEETGDEYQQYLTDMVTATLELHQAVMPEVYDLCDGLEDVYNREKHEFGGRGQHV
ncbi:hypothetical protein PG996_012407 [Apiospora saccharicola]|uniref:BTB domain-containing protein n=1 Tax=Apiospora saccharicola TaxID=335842 RepID=A0ABR1U4J2_9PEZI